MKNNQDPRIQKKNINLHPKPDHLISIPRILASQKLSPITVYQDNLHAPWTKDR